MKKYLLPIILVGALTGCESIYLPVLKEVPVHPTNPKRPTPAQQGQFALASTHWTDVSKIRDEATRLSYQVSKGQLTKVQAAQYLNRFRIKQVGRNTIDDSMYEVYLRSAVESQRGAINTDQSKLYIRNALQGWQQRWPSMENKPSNPAFTNFLMEVMDMKPLQ
ncbi:prokaryotic membrane lipolipid attachment site family protein [Neisseria canis]|uniref:Lipoprotein n=1 Tax=Neisseria canis TaxID=493 RepID=A0A448D904_9NEIS|nr:prokaryotic membrane lipolipid attachment site family protein [Neisseria canis]OSI13323.1 prokaryotic membrane lipolipid attachment site family protein [Neisseria canis]VEF01786.1 lipoprotein [Neisseria canis]